MSRIPTLHKENYKKRIARATRRMLIAWIAVLSVVAAALLFKVGQEYWPLWLMQSRSPIAGILLFIIVISALLSPIIVEFDSDPRPLSGPGRDPRLPPMG